MDEQPDYSAIGQITHGDEHQARRLRATLAVIARRTEDPALRRLVVKVLDGRESVRRVFEHPTFWSMATTSLDNLTEGLDQLSDEEREDVLARVGEERTDDEEIDALRDDSPVDPPPPPRRDDGTLR